MVKFGALGPGFRSLVVTFVAVGREVPSPGRYWGNSAHFPDALAGERRPVPIRAEFHQPAGVLGWQAADGWQ
jgi:hypothetical protein